MTQYGGSREQRGWELGARGREQGDSTPLPSVIIVIHKHQLIKSYIPVVWVDVEGPECMNSPSAMIWLPDYGLVYSH